MNVIDDTRNRVKSKAAGIGVGSRSVISNVVQESDSGSTEGGRSPLRAYNYKQVLIS